MFDLLHTAVQAQGCTLLGVEYPSARKNRTLRLYIEHDTTDGTRNEVSIDDCERVSEQVSIVMDTESVFNGDYDLEVSSPGLDRIIFSPQQLQHWCGHVIRLRLHEKLNGKRNLKGKLISVSDPCFVLQMEGEHIHSKLDWSMVDTARLVPDWENILKEAKTNVAEKV